LAGWGIKSQMRRTVAAIAFRVSTIGLATAHAETLTGKVVSTADGDTLTVLSRDVRYRVRIAAIDAPEKGQDYTHRSWQNLMQLAYGKEATLDCQKDGPLSAQGLQGDGAAAELPNVVVTRSTLALPRSLRARLGGVLQNFC
jgi:hypothetical protein